MTELEENLDFIIVNQRYPHIADQLRSLWGTYSCKQYLNCLVIDSRGNRRGFDDITLSALLDLIMVHDREFSL